MDDFLLIIVHLLFIQCDKNAPGAAELCWRWIELGLQVCFLNKQNIFDLSILLTLEVCISFRYHWVPASFLSFIPMKHYKTSYFFFFPAPPPPPYLPYSHECCPPPSHPLHPVSSVFPWVGVADKIKISLTRWIILSQTNYLSLFNHNEIFQSN